MRQGSPAMRLLLLVALGALGAVPLVPGRAARADGEPPVRREVVGAHFRVRCHFDAQRIATEALQQAEAAWAPVVALLGRAPVLAHKLEIHLYRNTDDYRRREQQLTRGRFARNGAFTSWATGAAYVALEPRVTDAVLARVGLSAVTRRTLAHEAAHLVVQRALPSFRQHPSWLAEGLAIHAADAACAPALGPGALARAPIAATRMDRFRALVREDRLPILRDVLHSGRYRDVGAHEQYAFWWALFRVLLHGARRARFRTLLNDLSGFPRGGGFRGVLRTRLTRAFGGPEGRFEDLERALAASAAGLAPAWDEVTRSLTVRGRRWVQLGFPDTDAVCWRTRPAGAAPYRILGTLEMLPTGRPRMDLLLGRTPRRGHVRVAFQAGPDAGVTLRRHGAGQGAAAALARAACPALDVGAPTPFEVVVTGATVRVRVAGRDVLTARVPGPPLSGPFGVRVPAGGGGIWTDVRRR